MNSGGVMEALWPVSSSDMSNIWVVRCVDGTVSVGDAVVSGIDENGSVCTLDGFKVDEVRRYGRSVKFFDPPHSAEIRISDSLPVRMTGLITIRTEPSTIDEC